jgi:hypothetical protein
MSIYSLRSLTRRKRGTKQGLNTENSSGNRRKEDLLSRVRLFYSEVLINGGFYVL